MKNKDDRISLLGIFCALCFIPALFGIMYSCEHKSKPYIQKDADTTIGLGLLPDKPEWVESVPTIVSYNFANGSSNAKGWRLPSKGDADGDGVKNGVDNCPTLYGLDGHGCPVPPIHVDTLPPIVTPPPPVDTIPKTDTTLPPVNSYTSVILSMPTPQQQENNECVSFATAYTMSTEWYYYTNSSSYDLSYNVFSPSYINNNANTFSYCGGGISMQMGLDILVNKGVCTWNKFPYTQDCFKSSTQDQDLDASIHHIAGYYKMSILDRTAIKQMLQQHHPIIIAILADDSFIHAKAGFIWKTFSGSGNLPHCITICGYDDSKNAYKIINSFGTTWGDLGFTWIDMDFLETGGHTAGNGNCYVIKLR